MTKRKIPKIVFKRVGGWCNSNSTMVCNTHLRAANLKIYPISREGRDPIRDVNVK